MLQEKLQRSTGRATVEYNSSKVLEGKYNCLSESRAGFDKDTIHVELQNKFLPIGADYIHSFGYNAPGDGSNTPTVVGASNKSVAPIKSVVIYSLAVALHSRPFDHLVPFAFKRFIAHR